MSDALVLNQSHTPRADIPTVQFPAWARWAVAVAFIALVLQFAAFFLVHTPVWGLTDMLVQAAIWATVLGIAIRIRPNPMAAPS